SMARLEIWVYSLAAELTRQWQTFSSPTPSVESILADLGLIGTEGLPPLIDAIGKADTQTFPIVELRERLQTLYKHQQQEKLVSSKFRLWLEREASQLADWFHQMPTADSLLVQSPEEMGGCLVKLQLYAPTLHTQALQTLNAYFTQLRPLGTQVILTHLNRLRQALQDTLNRYELKRQEHLRRESGAWRAYRNLITQIETRQWGSADQGALAWEAVFRALNLIYVSKLEAEAYALASQIINNLMLQTHQYATEIAQTDTLLTHLHNWFVQQCPPESSLSPVLKSFLAERINSWELRGQLEKWTGYSLHHWGNVSSLRLEILGEQILTRLQPICLAIYGECCASLALGISASNIQLINLGASSQKPSHLNLIL
ncbi:MAG: hypothetical protein WCD18_18765, partial [Thermosynechococcaceae cyanobacterium]